jgi:hypothetical protein
MPGVVFCARRKCIKMSESMRDSGFLVCKVFSSLGTVFVIMRSIDAFRGESTMGRGLCNWATRESAWTVTASIGYWPT